MLIFTNKGISNTAYEAFISHFKLSNFYFIYCRTFLKSKIFIRIEKNRKHSCNYEFIVYFSWEAKFFNRKFSNIILIV